MLLFNHQCSLVFFWLSITRIETLEASRCFNCGSYSHSLKECRKPRDNVAINNARKGHSAKRSSTQISRGQIRYYQKSKGKFDDLRPGFLSPETRECLGIGVMYIYAFNSYISQLFSDYNIISFKKFFPLVPLLFIKPYHRISDIRCVDENQIMT